MPRLMFVRAVVSEELEHTYMRTHIDGIALCTLNIICLLYINNAVYYLFRKLRELRAETFAVCF